MYITVDCICNNITKSFVKSGNTLHRVVKPSLVEFFIKTYEMGF